MRGTMKCAFLFPCLLLLSALLPTAQGAVRKEALMNALKTRSHAAELETQIKNLPKGVSAKLKSSLQREHRRAQMTELNKRQRVAACLNEVAKKGNINAAANGGVTLLMAVAAAGVDEATLIVLEENPALDAKDAEGRTALQYEQEGGGSALAKELSAQWVSAVETANVEAVRHLLACGVSASASVKGNPPLGLAMLRDQGELFDELSYNSPLVTDLMYDGRTLTEIALRKKNAAALIFLLANGAAALEPMRDGDSPLHYVLSLGDEACAESFIRGAKIGNRVEELHTTVACMAARVASPAVLKKILPLLPGAAEEDAYGNTPLHEAARRGSLEAYNVVQEVLPACPYANRRGETVLMHAALSGNAELVKTLLETLPPKLVKGKDADGRSAADYARLVPNNPVLPFLETAP